MWHHLLVRNTDVKLPEHRKNKEKTRGGEGGGEVLPPRWAYGSHGSLGGGLGVGGGVRGIRV